MCSEVSVEEVRFLSLKYFRLCERGAGLDLISEEKERDVWLLIWVLWSEVFRWLREVCFVAGWGSIEGSKSCVKRRLLQVYIWSLKSFVKPTPSYYSLALEKEVWSYLSQLTNQEEKSASVMLQLIPSWWRDLPSSTACYERGFALWERCLSSYYRLRKVCLVQHISHWSSLLYMRSTLEKGLLYLRWFCLASNKDCWITLGERLTADWRRLLHMTSDLCLRLDQPWRWRKLVVISWFRVGSELLEQLEGSHALIRL